MDNSDCHWDVCGSIETWRNDQSYLTFQQMMPTFGTVSDVPWTPWPRDSHLQQWHGCSKGHPVNEKANSCEQCSSNWGKWGCQHRQFSLLPFDAYPYWSHTIKLFSHSFFHIQHFPTNLLIHRNSWFQNNANWWCKIKPGKRLVLGNKEQLFNDEHMARAEMKPLFLCCCYMFLHLVSCLSAWKFVFSYNHFSFVVWFRWTFIEFGSEQIITFVAMATQEILRVSLDVQHIIFIDYDYIYNVLIFSIWILAWDNWEPVREVQLSWSPHFWIFFGCGKNSRMTWMPMQSSFGWPIPSLRLDIPQIHDVDNLEMVQGIIISLCLEHCGKFQILALYFF